MDANASRVERFNQLCEEVAAKRKAAADDDTVRYIAQLRLRREDLLARDLAGERVDVADLRWLSDALEKYAAAQEPIKVTLSVIGPDGVEREQRDGENVTDFFQRQRRERETAQALPNDVRR